MNKEKHMNMKKNMSKRKSIQFAILMLTIVCFMLTGCGKEKGESSDEKAENTAGVIIVAEDTDSTASVASDVKTDNTINNSEDNEDAKSGDSESVEKYEAFLSGNEKVGVSKVNLNSYLSDTSEVVPDKSGTYTMGELIGNFIKDRKKVYDGGYSVEEIEYAYVDLGQDGSSELVLHFISYMEGDEYSNIMVIKDLTGKLELCYFTEDGYRSYNYVNKDGIIAVGGSGGAASWYDSYRTLDSEGNVVFLYDSETMNAYGIYLGDVDYGETADKLGIGDELAIIRYSFDEYTDTEFNDESYQAYLNTNMYAYGMYDSDWNMTSPDEIYEPSSKYYEFMHMFSDKVYSIPEMDELLEKRLSEYGFTKDMLTKNDPDWMKWDGLDGLNI